MCVDDNLLDFPYLKLFPLLNCLLLALGLKEDSSKSAILSSFGVYSLEFG